MKNFLDQDPTIFSKQNELDNSLYEYTLRVCVCVRLHRKVREKTAKGGNWTSPN